MKYKRMVGLAISLVIIDQIVKIWLFGKNMVLLEHVLALRSVQNTGLALGMMQQSTFVALALSLLAFVALACICKKYTLKGFSFYGMAMVVGGAVGNLIDRLFLHYVRDMFELLFIDFYVFNMADVFVVVGAVLLGYGIIFREKKEWIKK